jgi:hypothetical protein
MYEKPYSTIISDLVSIVIHLAWICKMTSECNKKYAFSTLSEFAVAARLPFLALTFRVPFLPLGFWISIELGDGVNGNLLVPFPPPPELRDTSAHSNAARSDVLRETKCQEFLGGEVLAEGENVVREVVFVGYNVFCWL